MGDIVYKPLTKVTEHEYLLPLDGQTIDGTKYKRLVDYLGTATLPNLNGRYLRADTTPGTMVEAGLPNIKGSAGHYYCYTPNGKRANLINGAFTWNEDGGGCNTDNAGDKKGSGIFKFDASCSSAIYGKSTTVTPLTYTVRAYICYA